MQTLKPTNHLHSFNGGLKLDLHHDESTGKPIKTPPLPLKLILPLQQHQGSAAKLTINIGDYVFKGQALTSSNDWSEVPVHAPTSGNIIAIGSHGVPSPSGLDEMCITLEPDEQERWGERITFPNYQSMEADQLLQHIHNSGISGLGGATFPSASKLAAHAKHNIELLLINAAECEPYISCDDSLMRQYSDSIVEGINILMHCLKIKRCIIAIESTMPEAYAALETAIESIGSNTIELIIVPNIYPMGGERQLIKVITNKEVPINKYPADIGMICHNVATMAAIYKAVVKGEPLISRIVTMTGHIQDPRNLEVLLGTPIKDLIQFCGGYTKNIDQLTMGGSMMGFALKSDELPIVKSSNCILAASYEHLIDTRKPQPCIRCGLCEQACPANLLPQQLYWYSKSNDFDKAQAYHLSSCIECNCCSYVCPSHIPLVDYYRYAKDEIRQLALDQQNASLAKERYDAKIERLKNEQTQLEQKRKKTDPTSIRSEIAAALERSKQNKLK